MPLINQSFTAIFTEHHELSTKANPASSRYIKPSDTTVLLVLSSETGAIKDGTGWLAIEFKT